MSCEKWLIFLKDVPLGVLAMMRGSMVCKDKSTLLLHAASMIAQIAELGSELVGHQSAIQSATV